MIATWKIVIKQFWSDRIYDFYKIAVGIVAGSYFVFWSPFFVFGGDEHPDDLYQQGRFEAAKKAYAKADMDDPKDIRYRYNRGCAAYKNKDYDEASAAFASVLKRAGDPKVLFNASFNMGNTAFKQGDFESAARYYKQALTLKSENQEARYNMELALRALEEQEERQKQSGGQTSEGKKQSDEKGQQEDGSNEDTQQSGERQAPPETSGQSESPARSEKQDPSGQPPTGEQKKHGETPSEQQDSLPRTSPEGENQQQGNKEEAKQDLSGDLQPMQAFPSDPSEQGDESEGDAANEKLNRRKAAAFLNNVNEDRSQYLRLQMQERRGGKVPSGKDW